LPDVEVLRIFLDAAASVSSVPASVGQIVEVVLTVTNSGMWDATGLLPSMVLMSGSGYVAWRSGPIPAGPLTVTKGSPQSFTWTYTVTGVGFVEFRARVDGYLDSSADAIAGAAEVSMTTLAAAHLEGVVSRIEV
jgi:hypothetical protein